MLTRTLCHILLCVSLVSVAGCFSGRHLLIQRFDGTGAIDTSLNSGVPIIRPIDRTSRDASRVNGLRSLAIDAQDLIAIGLQETGNYTAELRNFSGTPFPRFGGIESAGFPVSTDTAYVPTDLAVVRGNAGTLGTGFVIAGHQHGPSHDSVALAKFDIDGLDRSFGSSGRVITRHPDYIANRANAIAFDNAGRIVVVGTGGRTHRGGSEIVLILRYLPDGRLDTTFGTSGFVLDDPTSRGIFAPSAVAIDGANRIVIGGVDLDSIDRTGLSFRIARYLPDGNLDRSFGTDGLALLPPVLTASAITVPYSLAIDGLGRIVAATTTQEVPPRGQIGRFLPSGEIDRSFGSEGSTVTAFPGDGGIGFWDLGVDARNRPVVCGATSPRRDDGVDSRLVVARYLENGLLDTSFSGDGFAVSDLSRSHCSSLAISGDRVTAGGSLFR